MHGPDLYVAITVAILFFIGIVALIAQMFPRRKRKKISYVSTEDSNKFRDAA